MVPLDSVTGKRVNRGEGYGLEIPLNHEFLGLGKAINSIQKNYKIL